MDNKLKQKIVACKLPVSVEKTTPVNDINLLLDDGYEVEDIVPYLEKRGGGIYSRSHGLYVDNALVILKQSEKKTHFSCRTVKKEPSFLEKMNDIVECENNNGLNLFKIMPLCGFLDPEAGQGIGKGTFAFELFFVSE